MAIPEPASGENTLARRDASLTDLLEALAAVVDPYELRQLWSQGLEAAASIEDRDRVLIAAAGRLPHLVIPAEKGRTGTDRLWLRHVAREAALRAGEVSNELSAAAQKVMREAVFTADAEVREWMASQEQRTSVLDFMRSFSGAAASVRELARLAHQLRSTGATALLDRDVVQALTAFHDALLALPPVSTGSVGEWMRVSSHELRQWAESPDAKHQLPILVRRLILETGNRVTSIHFPTGSGVTSGGWDGLVTADRASLYVPAGRSGWELSTENSAHAKATKDFANRVGSVRPDERREMTFVELICRPWTKVEEFRDEAAARNEFADVRGYNIEDLAAWLEQGPSTSIWFKELIGKAVAGARSIGLVWKTWLDSTFVALDENVVLAGRGRIADDIITRAASGVGITTVGGDIRLNELLAFFGAVAQLSSDERDSLRHLIVIDDLATARQVFETTAPMLALVTSPGLAALLPPSAKHHVFVAVPGGERVDITLPRVDPAAVADYFRKLGSEYHAATDRGELARRSLLALRRQLARHPELHRPTWAVPPVSAEVRRVLLLQTWDAERDADRSAVARFMGTGYDEVEERLREFANAADDPFVAVLDDSWHVVSATDSWLLLASQLSRSDLEAFGDLAIAILTDIDPLASLPDEERWRASLEGLTASYSPRMRRGVARTLALLGAVGSSADLGAGRSASTFGRGVVRRVLEAANQDPSFSTWTSVSPYLPLLVEAAPQEVINAIRTGLASEPPLMQMMFRDREDSRLWPRSSPHIQFVSTLATLAWSPDHFIEATDLLAELAEIDPGGRWSNRPLGSLTSIFCPWHPGTSAAAEQQIQAMARLRKNHPRVAWDVIVSLLPGSSTSVVVERGPEYRSWKQGEPQVSLEEYREIVISAARALLDEAGVDVGRWVTIIGEIDHIPEEIQQEFRATLEGLAERLADDHDRGQIWAALRSFTARHRQYADAKWALPEEFLATLDPLHEAFEPQDPRLRFGWLFAGGMIDLGDFRRRDDLVEYDAELDRRRCDAIGHIFESGGLGAILAFAAEVAFPGQVGLALARHVNDAEFDARLFSHLESDSEVASAVAFAYFGARFLDHGWPYIEALLDIGSPRGSARLLRSTWQSLDASARADALSTDVAREFWREFAYFGLGGEFDGVLQVARRLREVGRNAASVAFLSLYSRRTDSYEFARAITEGLEELMENPDADPEIGTLREYDFDLLMKAIANHRDQLGRDRVVRLEWFFLPALGFDPDAHNLHRALAEDPDFFVQMITLMYRPAGQTIEERPAPSEGERRAAENAFRLLHSWRTCPGTDESGSLDEAALRSWVGEARRLLAGADRASMGDDEIGQALVAAPGDEGGWPPRAVRDLVEEIRSDHLDRGFGRRIFNNRGVTSRSLDAGGRQEWDLAAKYRSIAGENRCTWPRLARIFDGLVETYEADARREDAAAERRRRGLD